MVVAPLLDEIRLLEPRNDLSVVVRMKRDVHLTHTENECRSQFACILKEIDMENPTRTP